MENQMTPLLSSDPSDQARGESALAALKALSQGGDAEREVLLRNAASGSPYLAKLIERDAAWLAENLSADPAEVMSGIIRAASDAADAKSETDLMAALRVQKRRAALLIGLSDLSGAWALDQVTRALTDFANTCVESALTWLLRDKDGDGLFILAMGKHGAGELNYSSDIDLIFFFEMGARDPANYGDIKKNFNRLTRSFVKIMQEQTADGYVFRTDLRLRPDPGSTAACMSVDAAARYYESFGKSWERAAYIKARVIAGDREAGARFLENMQPFIWRRRLDFATIEDVREIKRLIHRHKGHGEIQSAGHDIKLGRGGIREIEFFAQTQQLVAGGRDELLREPRTVEALRLLTYKGWVDENARAELTDSYVFLRRLEHRIQMTDDAQTHRVPDEGASLERLAAFCGLESAAELDVVLRSHLERVSAHFQGLFAELEVGGEPLPDEPDDLEAMLREAGFADPPGGAALIARWRDGDIPAMRTERARAILDRIAPRLLEGLSNAGDPDQALIGFDRFLAGLPGGVQLLSLFDANPNLLDLLTEICAAAPRLGGYLSRNAKVLDAVLARDFFDPIPDAAALLSEHQSVIAKAPEEDFEAVLDASRRWAKERHFQIGVQLLRGVAEPDEVARAYTALADAAIQGLIEPMTAELAKRNGPPPGGGACVIALGRLGAGEMTATSDLDLLVIYDEGDASASEGRVPLDPVQYYARWTQRLVRALTAPTTEGAVYEVDMRLRPSGRSGPLATRIAAFERYQLEDAWTWEHMALTRARIVCGPPELCARVEEVIVKALTRERDLPAARRDANQMRARIRDAEPKQYENPWELKSTRGGLTDADFIAQILLLGSRQADATSQSFDAAMQRIEAAELLSTSDRQVLSRARAYQIALIQLTRLTEDRGFDPERSSKAQRALIARALGEPDFERVVSRLGEEQGRIATLFEQELGKL